MNAIQKAIELLRDIRGVHAECECACHKVADELEALLQQEPVAYGRNTLGLLTAEGIKETPAGFPYKVFEANKRVVQAHEQFDWFPVWGYPPPPCDLKALAEEIKESVINAWGGAEGCSEYSAIRAVDIDAVIAKHMNWGK